MNGWKHDYADAKRNLYKPMYVKRSTFGTFFTALFLLIMFGGVGGCMKIDYHFFKQRYPQSSLGGYIWHRTIGGGL